MKRVPNECIDSVHRPVVCVSDLFWDEHWSSEQQLMSRFSATCRVLYVERPVSVLSFFTGIADASVGKQFRRWTQGGLRQEGENLYVLTPPPCLPFRYNPVVNRINQALRVRSIKRAMKKLDISKPILWIYEPDAGVAVGKFQEILSIYHCADDWAGSPHWWNQAQSIRAREENLLRKASVVFVTSRKLLADKAAFAHAIYYIPNGVSITDFSGSFEEPRDMAGIPRPVIGCSAVYNNRYDYGLLRNAAAAHKGWSFVFVGPVLVNNEAVNDLRALQNVHFLGNKAKSDLGGYIRQFDVCLIPYRPSAFNDAAFPLKLMEYFFFGKPVVSLRLASMAEFQDLVYLYESEQGFEGAVEKASKEKEPGKEARRMDIANQNTWEGRVNEIEAILPRHLSGLSNESKKG